MGPYQKLRLQALLITILGNIVGWGREHIFKEDLNVEGLTTAACLWAVAAIGLAMILDFYIISILTAILMVFWLALPRFTW